MTIVDRYLAWLFFRTVLICFFSFAGLYVVVHLFSNLDELTAISEQIGWGGVFQNFYLPRFAELFDKSAGILILVAALFSISLMQRRREITAVESSGITKSRCLRAVLVVSTVFILLAVVNREFLIPQLKDKLVRTPQSWGQDGVVEFTAQTDPVTGVVMRGEQLMLEEDKVTAIEIQLPPKLALQLPRIEAQWGVFKSAGKWNPEGIWLHHVKNIDAINEIGSLKNDQGETVLFTPKDHPWVGTGQCFVRCHFEPQQIAFGGQLGLYRSTPEMVADLKKPHRWSTRPDQISIHSRIVKPFLEMTLILLGLPIVVGGVERNVFVAAGICFWAVVLVQVVTAASAMLGASSLIRPPALAAWLPLMVFVPWASVAMRRLKR